MNREQMIEAAIAFDSQQGCLIGRCFSCEADFAIEQVKAERKRIADELIQLHKLSPADFLRELSYYVQELAGQDSMAHRLLDELREQNEHRKDD